MASTDNQYHLSWSKHTSHIQKSFDELWTSNQLVDVTLHCDGGKINAHKVLLSMCSGYFREAFRDAPAPHPMVILYGIDFSVLSSLVHFMYTGEVNLDRAKLDLFIKTAHLLQIHGLTDISDGPSSTKVSQDDESQIEPPQQPLPSTSTQQALATTTVPERKKGVKRVQKPPPEPPEDRSKLLKQENGTSIFVADIKSEPAEGADLAEPGQDPLQQELEDESKDLFEITAVHTMCEEELKLERPLVDAQAQGSEQRVRHSNFSEDCLKCTICNKIFSHPYSLHHHKAVHSGNTRCPICQAVLSRKYNLKMHMKARHNL